MRNRSEIFAEHEVYQCNHGGLKDTKRVSKHGAKPLLLALRLIPSLGTYGKLVWGNYRGAI